jgi:hypothetical protein
MGDESIASEPLLLEEQQEDSGVEGDGEVRGPIRQQTHLEPVLGSEATCEMSIVDDH